MWEFIVSGRLPGSSIQITFDQWAFAMLGLVALLFLIRLARRFSLARLRLALLSLYAAHVIRNETLEVRG